jgi:hypothetical protein
MSTKASMSEANRKRLREMRALKVTHFGILPSTLMGECCPLADQAKDKVFTWEELPYLPMPGCTAKKCCCIYTVELDPAEPLDPAD